MVPFHLQGSPLSTVLPSSTAIYNLKNTSQIHRMTSSNQTTI